MGAGASGGYLPPQVMEQAAQPPTMSLQEELADSGLKKLWSMHNKVEHYWDTYVRYRYLGDCCPVYPDGRDQGGTFKRLDPPLGLPTVEGLLKGIENPPNHVREYLSRRETRFLIEKPLCFPQIYCDRATRRDGLENTTLYEVVATKANPPSDLHPELVKERGKLGGSERSKLDFFTSASNDHGAGPTSWNYLTYFVCPDLAKVQRFGADFYDPGALVEFVASARGVASAFVGSFWNLDTGLGLKVQCLGNASPEEAVTRLDFVHVFEPAAACSGVDVAGERPFLAGKKPAQYKPKSEMKAKNAVLERLPSPTGTMNPSTWTVETLFAPGEAPCSVADCPTEKLLPQPKLLISKPKPCLSLWLRIPMARLGAQDGALGYFLHADVRSGRGGAVQQENGGPPLRLAKEMTEGWLEEAFLVDTGTGSDSSGKSQAKGSLQAFSTALRLSLDPSDANPAGVDPAAGDYRTTTYELGRNYAVGTGRRSVLHPVHVKDAFNPKEQLAPYQEVSPTEQVFFSLYVIVKQRDGSVFEAMSGEKITDEVYKKLRRIDAAGFVKIVLHYETGPQGTLHFRECFVDGLQVPVEFSLPS